VKNIVVILSGVFAVVLAAAVGESPAASGPPVVGRPLPAIELPTPADAAQRRYLGLEPGAKTFRIGQIRAKVVIIEIFSMYCPHCQREAPTVNALYRRIESDPTLSDRVRLIGIGVGNSTYEVNFFRRKYKVSFPLFADADFVIHKQLGEVRTPYFLAVQIEPGGATRVLYSRLGGAEDAGALLRELMQRLSAPR